MEAFDTVIAVLPNHAAAEAAIKTLAQAGIDLTSLSVVGNGYALDERIAGFYGAADRITLWGARGAFWGGLWGLFFSATFIATAPSAPVVALGFIAGRLIAALEGALIVGGLSALGAGLTSLGVPRDAVVSYESDVQADKFLVLVHGGCADAAHAKSVLGAVRPRRLDVHRAPETVALSRVLAPLRA